MQFLLRDFYRVIKLYGWCLGTFCTREEKKKKILLLGSAWGKIDSANIFKGPIARWCWDGLWEPRANPDFLTSLQPPPLAAEGQSVEDTGEILESSLKRLLIHLAESAFAAASNTTQYTFIQRFRVYSST